MSATRVLALLLVLTAIARVAVDRGSRRPATAGPPPRLPASIAGVRARAVALERSEQVLAAREGVTLTRVAYGASQVGLVTTTGVKELHPPEACLRAAGLEIVTRVEEGFGLGCALRFEVRRPGGQVAWLYLAYLEEGGPGPGCSSWQRFGRAAWAQLAGRPRRGAALEVMDRDRDRARATLSALIAELRAPR
jgi:hypothetical protein